MRAPTPAPSSNDGSAEPRPAGARRSSTSIRRPGSEGDCGRWLAAYLRARGLPRRGAAGSRTAGSTSSRRSSTPRVVFSTHFDCVPPFFPSREAGGRLHGRGACDAKGILAAQVYRCGAAARGGRARHRRCCSSSGRNGGATARERPTQSPNACRFLINGEPTDSRLGAATRGAFRVKLSARGPRRALVVSRRRESRRSRSCSTPSSGCDRLELARAHPLLGRTHYTVGLISGGIAPNVIPPHAEAEVMFRTVGPAAAPRAAARRRCGTSSRHRRRSSRCRRSSSKTVAGLRHGGLPIHDRHAVPRPVGPPLLMGPGSIFVAHTDHEHVAIAELHAASIGSRSRAGDVAGSGRDAGADRRTLLADG